MARVVSLVPSVTETLVALRAPPVGCTRFCDQPGIPAVGGTKNPDIPAIERLLPHVVIVNDEENRIEDVEAIEELGIPTVSVSPRSVEDVGAAILRVAEAADVDDPDGFDEASWKQWLEEVRHPPVGVTAFVAVWARPWMTLNVSTYGSSLLDLLGIDNLYGAAHDRYPEVRVEDVQEQRPSIVLLPTEPYPFKETHVDRVGRAFEGSRVSLVDGRDLFWWGIRTPEAIRRLSSFLVSLSD